MNTHNGYDTKGGEEPAAKCTKCGAWIPEGFKAVSMEPGVVSDNGGVEIRATAIHGILCMGCYEEL